MSDAEGAGLSKAARVRRGALVVVLIAAALVLLAKHLGFFAFLEAPGFTGKLEVGEAKDITVEQVDLAWPPARLVVARVPRRKGYRLRAVLLDDEQPLMKGVSATETLGALVAINGDFYRLDGFCVASPFSTHIDDGRPRALGSPYEYAAQFWLDADGGPHVGALDVRGRLVAEDGQGIDVHYNLILGDALLVDRHPTVWSSEDRVGLPLNPGDGSYTVLGPFARRFEGPALLVSEGTPAHAFAQGLKPGAKLRFEQTGADAGKARVAIGTGPHLVTGGAAREEELAKRSYSGWVLRHQRTAVGFTDDEVLLVTTLQAPRCGLTMVELARVMQALGCQEALNLDGGPSSTMWARTGWQGGRVVNLPEGEVGEQPVATALIVLPPLAGDPGVR